MANRDQAKKKQDRAFLTSDQKKILMNAEKNAESKL